MMDYKYLENITMNNSNFVDELNRFFDKTDEISCDIFSKISFDTLQQWFLVREQLNLPEHIKQDITWFYYHLITKNGCSSYVLSEMTKLYNDGKCFALESVFVSLIRNNLLDNSQLSLLSSEVQTKEITKRLLEFELTKFVKNDYVLSSSEVKKLFKYRLYDVLKIYLSSGRVNEKALKCFAKPSEGERDYKHKLALYLLSISKT